ncbi:MAG: type II toxin-antitoxin system Phd/YefM family antitoxin [Olsenella sp.]|jgi:antitoxin (DNA-binding transcriptional repressor) of toxin-antitoxin stability system|nr:type II toxin-antitoxin system Phd/YefM family antitoxin [Olsenella sp.]MCH3947778.1 type II toxin-antitoxin system Phd/YefM family antitoxin [Olsenella sp.]MCH3956381.1 type II toxin-antitoxin system Phd/YefM family antitoxin [Olsenella sp.]MCI1794503.1 type II toxin-antitoxin system Phd/YefM family antitoxin [Olsenella sp.]MCI1812156.1 type II toxin-antitoxin system Phd/YefM family antitoxin [Olsenella sp.]
MAYIEVDLEGARHFGLAEAKAGFSGIVADVESAGEACVIERYGRPAALVVPYPSAASGTTRARGVLKSYASPEKRKQESGAFARAMEVKHVGEARAS